MIRYLERTAIDEEKYNLCIEKSLQSRLSAYTWYLDIVAENWSVLVLEDYKAVMPICWRKKGFVKYVYPPFWVLELGVFSAEEAIDFQQFYKVLFSKFKFAESKLNTCNNIQQKTSFLVTRQMQILNISDDADKILESFRKDRKKDLQKAEKAELQVKWNDDPKKLIQLFKNNVGQRTPFLVEKDYSNLLQLLTICIEKKVGEVLSIYNSDNDLVASGFFLKHKNTVTILVSSTDFNFRKNGENTFLIHTAIQKYHNQYQFFNFGGSSMESIANYFLSFGAKTKEYQQIKYNNLPSLLKKIKG
ncbi:GNAT family N-acetyltransferase [Polaribacter dokdonensis]|uniref:BioF2-like acetyltransferase domain-containing protein n=1 Tax=Polaribacter dokdonensis DSW-5 TaxID=1300348 RepID=A0A0M9CFK0_9FLAO|nr:GNAT family N-acetyltransferase [Polaribacter dokdonensis]KOY50925.1 hypothetical protein I602_485 [Polaribacter dokdonensis DSW-5]SEE22679.1 hypothetical protein SAMN05444353_1300 [Polaribacter dokdonensis DSW-5]